MEQDKSVMMQQHGESSSHTRRKRAHLLLEDGSSFAGELFGSHRATAGEVVFNTGMVGYPESMTDPSYRGQILVLTYPLVGNYGIPVNGTPVSEPEAVHPILESETIHIRGLVISDLSPSYSHWTALSSLDEWMERSGIVGIRRIDTRALTKRLRQHGCMLGKIVLEDGTDCPWDDPNKRHLAAEVSITRPVLYRAGDGLRPSGNHRSSTARSNGDQRPRMVLVDLGTKHDIIRNLLRRGFDVLRVPWNYPWLEEAEASAGVVLSNGPGDPKMCAEVLPRLREATERRIPLLGICLGHQLIALAAGGDTYKMKYGHRSQNQPCIEQGSPGGRCYITSQNHGFAVNAESLPDGWQTWFVNANDQTNEGLRHRDRPVISVQFHPEAHPGPTDTNFLFDLFAEITLDHARRHRRRTGSGLRTSVTV